MSKATAWVMLKSKYASFGICLLSQDKSRSLSIQLMEAMVSTPIIKYFKFVCFISLCIKR